MSKKIIATVSLLAAVSAVAVSGNASAAVPGINLNGISTYVSGGAQYLFSKDDTVKYSNGSSTHANNDYGYGLTIAAGAKLDNYRAELEFGYLKSDVDSFNSTPASGVTQTIYTYMVNGYYDFKNKTPFTPYVGAGLGIAHGKFSEPGVSNVTANEFAYQAMAGVSYEINKNSAVYGGYRYVGTNDFDLSNAKVSYSRNVLEAGYRFSF